MSATRAWDRAGSLPVPVDGGLARPELVTLAEELPSVDELFTFMRDAELRFRTLRLRIEERASTTRGEERSVSDVMLQHPGKARVLTTKPSEGTRDNYEVWLTDGETVWT